MSKTVQPSVSQTQPLEGWTKLPLAHVVCPQRATVATHEKERPVVRVPNQPIRPEFRIELGKDRHVGARGARLRQLQLTKHSGLTDTNHTSL